MSKFGREAAAALRNRWQSNAAFISLNAHGERLGVICGAAVMRSTPAAGESGQDNGALYARRGAAVDCARALTTSSSSGSSSSSSVGWRDG